jgi:protein-S-isoprenylcysteine O-methyltransferase Ste14
LVIFFALNLFNLLGAQRRKRGVSIKSVTVDETPEVKFLALSMLGTSVFFLLSITYPILVFTGLSQLMDSFSLQLRFQYDVVVQGVGILFEIVGYSLFAWSVIARGRFATSWEMSENHKLVTWGPYRYVRHPSYTAYFLMFLGLFFLLLNLLALVTFIAIPGYIGIATCEEQMLTSRFSNEYMEYEKKVGRFLPKKG